jgi:hypothetical protein
VQWPKGWSGADHPLRLLNDWGHEVAKPGQELQMNGGLMPDGMGVAYCAAAGPDNNTYVTSAKVVDSSS